VLAARASLAAWDLRAAWATQRVVILILDDSIAQVRRVAGRVVHVSPTDARAVIDQLDGERIDVPCAVVLTVRRPHFHEPADMAALEPVLVESQLSGQLAFPQIR
jgi:hypothetical protein